MEELFEVLAGNVIDVSPEVLDQFSQKLGIPRDKLEELNASDVEVEGTVVADEAEEEEEENAEEEAPEEQSDEDENLPENLEEEEDAATLPAEEESPEDTNEEENQEEENAGGSEIPGDDEEDEEDKPKGSGKKLDEKDDVQTDDFRSCVSQKIREAIDAGKDQDGALAFALASCRRDSGKSLSPDEWSGIFDELKQYQAQKLADSLLPPSEEDKLLPSDEDQEEKNLPLPAQPTTALEGTADSDGTLGENPALQTAQQTNVLLSQVIGMLQRVEKVLLDSVQQNQLPNQATLPAAVSNMSAPETPLPQGSQDNNKCLNDPIGAKQLDIIGSYKQKLEQKLNKYGV